MALDAFGSGGLPGMGFSLATGINAGGVRDMNVYGPQMGTAAPSAPGGMGVSGSISAGVGTSAAGPAALLLITAGLVVLYMATRSIQGSR